MSAIKIVAIAQIYNELEKGNLKRFVKYLKPLVDEIVVYDDGSTDGSFEYMQSITPHVIRGGKNDFENEGAHRQLLVEKAKKLGADYILWLDADEILTTTTKVSLQKSCQNMEAKKIDGLSLHEINIWRSRTWQRIDSLYNNGWFVRLWKVTPELSFLPVGKGLHKSQYPRNIKKISKTNEIAVLHYGFSTEKSLAYKYLIYKSYGQRGYVLLDRLISEDKLILKKVPQKLFPNGLYVAQDLKPQKKPFAESLAYVEKYKKEAYRPKYSIVCLIYQSVEWLEFVYKQVLKYTEMKDVEFIFIANDATHEVKEFLKNNYIPHFIWDNTEKNKNEWYINNVYRAWNFGAKKAQGDFITFINSDMAFSPYWLENLIKHYNGKNCITSRLVESGKLKSGEYGVGKNFGRSTTTYQEEKFLRYATRVSEDKVLNGGLFMPLFIKRSDFLSVNGYPEGNIVSGSNILKPKIAKKGEACISGDVVLMEKLKKKGITHLTAFNSIVYHFQEGEMDSKKTKINSSKSHIAICNDIVTGTLGEKVVWDYLLEKLSASYGVDTRLVGKKNYEKKAKEYIQNNYPQTDIIIQNASFIDSIDTSKYTILFLQDNLRAMNKKSLQQEKNLKKANKLVTNSSQITLSYPEYDFDIIPIGVNEKLFYPSNMKALRKKHSIPKGKVGIFVGNLSEVKGWPEVKKCIKHFPEITWIIVSKYNESFQAKNVHFFNQISQKTLAELYNCADFFILGSPVETQCLSAIEAALCNTPIIMRNTGIFKDFTEEEKNEIGIFGDNFIEAVNEISRKKLNPRYIMLKKDITVENTIQLWKKVLEKSSQDIILRSLTDEDSTLINIWLSEIINTVDSYKSYIGQNHIMQKILGKLKNGKQKLLNYA